jgi:antitoxin VapB
MALSIKTAEADELARALARLTGESMTDAVTVALRERLARERAKRAASADLPARLTTLAERLRAAYDTTPDSKAERDAASGDDFSTTNVLVARPAGGPRF